MDSTGSVNMVKARKIIPYYTNFLFNGLSIAIFVLKINLTHINLVEYKVMSNVPALLNVCYI